MSPVPAHSPPFVRTLPLQNRRSRASEAVRDTYVGLPSRHRERVRFLRAGGLPFMMPLRERADEAFVSNGGGCGPCRHRRGRLRRAEAAGQQHRLPAVQRALLRLPHADGRGGQRLRRGQRPTGPNLDYRKEDHNQVLYAIRNGGFSGAIMPQNIVVGKDAEQVADFVAKYAGSKSIDAAGARSVRTTARASR